MDADFLTGEQVARMLRVSRAHVYRLIQRGEIPCIHFGRLVRVRRADLLLYLESKRTVQPDAVVLEELEKQGQGAKMANRESRFPRRAGEAG